MFRRVAMGKKRVYGLARYGLSVRFSILRTVPIWVFLVLFSVACGRGGTATPGGNDIDEIEVLGEIEVDSIFIRSGVNSNTVVSDDFISTVYVGRRYYQQSDADFSLSFNPSRNFLTTNEFEDDE